MTTYPRTTTYRGGTSVYPPLNWDSYCRDVREMLLDIAAAGGSIVVGGVDPDGLPLAARGWSVEPGGDGDILVVVQDEPGLRPALQPGHYLSVTVANVLTYQAIQCRGVILASESLGGEHTARALQRSQVFVEQVARAHHDDPSIVAAMIPHELLGVRIREEEFFDQAPKSRVPA